MGRSEVWGVKKRNKRGKIKEVRRKERKEHGKGSREEVVCLPPLVDLWGGFLAESATLFVFSTSIPSSSFREELFHRFFSFFSSFVIRLFLSVTTATSVS